MPRDRRGKSGQTSDSTQPKIPKGMIPITNDPYNPFGYRDPGTGYEYDARTGRPAWQYGGSGIEVRMPDGQIRMYKTMPAEKLAITGEASRAAASTGGVPVGGQAASPGATGIVGDMQSLSNAAPTVMSQGRLSSPTPMGAGATKQLPFKITATPAVDIGAQQAGAGIPVPAQSLAIPAITPMQWDTISRVQPIEVPIPQRQQMTMPMPRSMAPSSIPVVPQQQESSPWYKNIIRSIFG